MSVLDEILTSFAGLLNGGQNRSRQILACLFSSARNVAAATRTKR